MVRKRTDAIKSQPNHPFPHPLLPFPFPEVLRGSVTDLFSRGGAGSEFCAALLNHEFERVIYKTVYGFRVTILNLYMVGFDYSVYHQSLSSLEKACFTYG